MGEYNFGEKQMEYSAKRQENIPVWQSPKYLESRKKACEILDSGKYALSPADFWILMNETKSGKMGYTGLIISHNGCLKINDGMAVKFDPASVSIDKDGYGGSLVYTYSNATQGIYEVGEVSSRNCKNDYPHAMAFKRLFDRVVLKLSKLAYSGIYSEAESDEFRDPLDDARQTAEKPAESRPKKNQPVAPPPADTAVVTEQPLIYMCEDCGHPIVPMQHRGKFYTVKDIETNARKTYGASLCWGCMTARKNAG